MTTSDDDSRAGPPREQVTGLVLAGGRGSRMGGVDKGLEDHLGLPLARHALQRLGPQVGALMISANRNLDAYRAMGVPVWPDPMSDYPGPLAGLLAGLQHARSPYLVTVPCDSPHFPDDLVARLGAALLAADAEIAVAATVEHGRRRAQPVFCLLHTRLLGSLVAFLASGERKVDRWTARHRMVEVAWDDPAPFANANTRAELAALRADRPRSGHPPAVP
jgi:molybdopterin-guanine dinucleotide biosynthesis protein A